MKAAKRSGEEGAAIAGPIFDRGRQCESLGQVKTIVVTVTDGFFNRLRWVTLACI